MEKGLTQVKASTTVEPVTQKLLARLWVGFHEGIDRLLGHNSNAFSDTTRPTMDQKSAAARASSNGVLGAPSFTDIRNLRIRVAFE